MSGPKKGGRDSTRRRPSGFNAVGPIPAARPITRVPFLSPQSWPGPRAERDKGTYIYARQTGRRSCCLGRQARAKAKLASFPAHMPARAASACVASGPPDPAEPPAPGPLVALAIQPSAASSEAQDDEPAGPRRSMFGRAARQHSVLHAPQLRASQPAVAQVGRRAMLQAIAEDRYLYRLRPRAREQPNSEARSGAKQARWRGDGCVLLFYSPADIPTRSQNHLARTHVSCPFLANGREMGRRSTGGPWKKGKKKKKTETPSGSRKRGTTTGSLLLPAPNTGRSS